MIDILLYLEILLVGTLLLQPSQSRLYTGGVFVGVLILHEIFFSASTGLMYYGMASLFYVTIIMLTAVAAPVTRLVLDIHKICLASIFINALGWALWFFYFPPAIYNIAYLGLHCWAIYTLMQRIKRKEDGFRTDWGSFNFRFYANAWDKYLPQYKGQT